MMSIGFEKNVQYYKFCLYGFLKNLRFFDAFFILFLLEKELSYTEIGTLYAVREILTNIFEVPSGIIADRYGRKTALTASFIAYIISFVLFFVATGFVWFLFAFVLFGLADAFRSGTHKAMIMDYLKLNKWETQKINYYGHTRACSQKGSAVSSLAAGLIVFYAGNYGNIFLFSIVPYMINFLLIMSYPADLNLSVGHKKRLGIGEMLKSFYVVVKRPKVWRIINSSAVFTAYQKAVKDYIQLLMLGVAVMIPVLNHYETKKKTGLIIGLIYFVVYLLTSRASQLASKIAAVNKNKVAYSTLLVGFTGGILSGIFQHYELWIFALLAFVLIYIIENIRKPILTGFLADQVPNEILTSVISVQSLYRTILTSLIALLFGWAADVYGIGISFILVTGILLIGVAVLNHLIDKPTD